MESNWDMSYIYTPSGKRLRSYGKSPFLMGKSYMIYIYIYYITNNMVIHELGITSSQLYKPDVRPHQRFPVHPFGIGRNFSNHHSFSSKNGDSMV